MFEFWDVACILQSSYTYFLSWSRNFPIFKIFFSVKSLFSVQYFWFNCIYIWLSLFSCTFLIFFILQLWMILVTVLIESQVASYAFQRFNTINGKARVMRKKTPAYLLRVPFVPRIVKETTESDVEFLWLSTFVCRVWLKMVRPFSEIQWNTRVIFPEPENLFCPYNYWKNKIVLSM